MAQFPKNEAAIVRLAYDLIAGFTAHPGEFPAPPVPPEELSQALAAYNAVRETAIEASASAVQGTALKDEALGRVMDMMKSNIRYAENASHGDDSKLQLVGWGGRRSPTINDIPGQVRTLEVIREGKSWVFLDWKEPVEGGQVAAYKVQRRKRDTGDWIDVGMAVESEITLSGQEPGVEFEYQVIAVNKAGEGPASNIVRAVL